MAQQAFLFLHLIGLATWFGSTVTLLVLVMAARTQAPAILRFSLPLAHRINVLLASPAAVILLGAGITMTALGHYHDNSLPVWFKVMEMGGGTLVLLSLPIQHITGARMVRRLKLDQPMGAVQGAWQAALSVTAVAICGIVATVALQLGA